MKTLGTGNVWRASRRTVARRNNPTPGSPELVEAVMVPIAVRHSWISKCSLAIISAIVFTFGVPTGWAMGAQVLPPVSTGPQTLAGFNGGANGYSFFTQDPALNGTVLQSGGPGTNGNITGIGAGTHW